MERARHQLHPNRQQQQQLQGSHRGLFHTDSSPLVRNPRPGRLQPRPKTWASGSVFTVRISVSLVNNVMVYGSDTVVTVLS